MSTKLKRYNKKENYSFTYGAFPTFEALSNRPECLSQVVAHPTANPEILDHLQSVCSEARVPFEINGKLVERLRNKDAHIVIGVFEKYTCRLSSSANHVVLVQPSDSGNLGTIIRTCVGFGIRDLALIGQAADIFNPKVVRASMGSLFRLNFQYFQDFEEYAADCGENRQFFPFMLNGAKKLGTIQADPDLPFSLIFGNEATGLDDSFLEFGQSVLISHTSAIDSLNLSLAVGIALYEFTKPRFF